MPLPEGRECTKCKQWLSSDDYYAGKKKGTIRSQCKECSSKATLSLYRKKRNQKDIDFIISRLASSLIGRVKYNDHYTQNEIKNNLGNHPEIVDILKEQFILDIQTILEKGESPSIDRIDNKVNYDVENIRIIPLRENALLGLNISKENNKKPLVCVYPNGNIADFESVTDAHLTTGLDTKTIRDSANLMRKTRAGYKFTFINEREAE